MARISQKQIAEELGVSPTTVSFVVRDPETRRVARKTRERVLAHMKRRAPDLLPDGNHGAVCFLIAEFVARSGSIYETYYAPVLHGVEDVAREAGRLVVFMRWTNVPELRRALSHHSFAGVLCVNEPPDGLRVRRDGRPIPMVVVNARPAEPLCDSFAVDDRRAFAQAVRYLHSHGHRRIAYVGPSARHSANAANRIGGYVEGIRALGLPLRPKYQGVVAAGYEEVKAVLSGLMELVEPPTAVLTFNDELAVCLIDAARERPGLSVPDDLSVIGYDDAVAFRCVVPPLTSFRQPREEMGRRAMEALLLRMEQGNADRPCAHTLLEAELVERRSVVTCRQTPPQ